MRHQEEPLGEEYTPMLKFTADLMEWTIYFQHTKSILYLKQNKSQNAPVLANCWHTRAVLLKIEHI